MSTALEFQLGVMLHNSGTKLAAAESCTGGLVSHRITDVPGSSEYFMGGIVAYAFQAKVDLLGVSWDTLNRVGAVSREVVIEMAYGARKIFKVDIAVSVSGIAGPGGGTPEKPVGTTWIALVASDGEWTRQFVWDGDREKNKYLSSEAVLQLLMDYLEGNLK
ncbi:MAG: CinA family protein [Anaerolineales bacterium]